jgi:hypothetical protein
MKLVFSLYAEVLVDIRLMRPEEKDEVVLLSKSLNKFVRDFNAIWTRWEMWEKSPPIVAVLDGKIVGFHGVSYLKNDYIYTMYIGVSELAAGTGAAKAMTWFAIQEGQRRGLTRFTAKADTRGGGYNFYTGLGMKPVAATKTEFVFDCEFGDSKTLEEFRERLKSGVANTLPSPRKQKLYLKNQEECYFEASVHRD